MKNTEAQTAIDAPVGIDNMNEKKYPNTADKTPIITENTKTKFSFSVRQSEDSAGRANKAKTGKAPKALVATVTTNATVIRSNVFNLLTGYLNNLADSVSNETKMKSL